MCPALLILSAASNAASIIDPLTGVSTEAPREDLPRRLCDDRPYPDCPEAVEIPDNFGLQWSCGDEELTDGNSEIIWDMPMEYGSPMVKQSWYDDVALEGQEPSWDVRTTYRKSKPSDFFGFKFTSIHTGKRFKPGIFKIQKAYHRLDVTGPSGEWTYNRLGRIEYTVTCENGITYKDEYTWKQFDHYCEDHWNGDNCSDGMRDFSPMDVTYDPSSLIIGPELGSERLRIPVGDILKRWQGRYVGAPHYYGGPNTLSNPVVLINGLGFDFRSMGAIPKDAPGTEGWRKGYVSGYLQGSLPDVISRAYGLAKGENAINHNGIYFVNLDINAGLSLANKEYQFNLLDRLGDLVVDHAAGLPITPDLKVNVVCHSTSCIALREAIANVNEYVAENPLIPNPVDHIQRIITVNAPHEGSGLGRPDGELANLPIYGGLVPLIDEIVTADPNRPVISGTIHVDWSDIASGQCGTDFWDEALCWLGGQELDWMTEAIGFGICLGSQGETCPDLDILDLTVKGPIFGPYKVNLDGWQIKNIPGQPSVRSSFLESRTSAIDVQTNWLTNRKAVDYPKRSNGKFIDVLPFYSEESNDIETGIARDISNGVLGGLCGDNRSDNCRAAERYVNDIAAKTMNDALGGLLGGDVHVGNGAVDLHINQGYLNMIQELKSGWLKNSDFVVEKESQVWGLSEPKRDQSSKEIIPQLHVATNYKLHDAEVPVGHPNRPVLHGPLFGFASNAAPPSYLEALGTGASLMGRDLFCGIEPSCSELLGRNRPVLYAGKAVKRLMPVVLLPNGTIDSREIYTQLIKLEGDFDLYPQILSGDFAGVALQDAQGNNKAIVGYDPEVGTWIWVDGPNGGTTEILMEPDHRTQFTFTRDDEKFTLTLNSLNGGKRIVPLGSISDNVVNLVAIGDGLAVSPVLLVGDATPYEPESQIPPVAWGDVRTIIQERGGKESAQSRPWIWLTNKSDIVQKNLEVVYYFTADPERNPVVEMDYPLDLMLQTEHIGGWLWAFHVSVPELPVKQAFPQTGMQVRIHYSDWTPWAKSDDPSIGTVYPQFLETVVVRDALGRVIWGHEPSPALTMDAPSNGDVSVTWEEKGESDAKMIRPKITIKNVGTTSIASGYRVLLRIAGIAESDELPILDGFYSPDNIGVLSRESDGIVRAEWEFRPMILEPNNMVDIGEWGIHWADHRVFNKADLRYQVDVLDANGILLAQIGALEDGSPEEGNPPPTQTGPAVVMATWQDAASSGEMNTIRPDVQIQNLASDELSMGYKVVVRMAGLPIDAPLPLLVGDYHPDNEASISREADGHVRMEWTFSASLPASASNSLGYWRVHTDNWQPLDKSSLSYSLQVLNSAGVEIFASSMAQP
ncbi:MAG: hypothetical protein H6686_12475 [Fibrobacteria bacterium]|nr:hypothetical protein [Fibrobacteria bacterium]